MIAAKSKFDRYIDGVVKICKRKDKKSDFGARHNVDTMDDLEVLEKLNYQEMSKRVEDITFANQEGFELTMKIKVRKIKNVTSENVVVIDHSMHSIKYIDSDKENLYLYLQGERKIETGNNQK